MFRRTSVRDGAVRLTTARVLLLAISLAGDSLLAHPGARVKETAQVDQDPPYVWINSPADGSRVRTPHLVVTGGAWDERSAIASVACNGVNTDLVDQEFSCTIDLVSGLNTITVQATDAAANTASTTITVTFDDTFTVHVDSPVEVPAGTLTTLWGESQGPADKPRTYQWTQLSGAAVVLQGADTANVSFLTPNEDATLTFQLTVSNTVATLTAQTEVHVQSFGTSLHVQPGPGEGHDSTLVVASTSLLGGARWRAADTTFVVSLTSDDGAVLDPASEDIPLALYLDAESDIHDVTAWFDYDATEHTLSLQSGHVSDFRSLLFTADVMELQIVGSDSLAHNVSLTVPFMYAAFQIQGTLTAPAGTPAGTLQQAIVLLQGADRKYNAVATPAADGSFAFDAVVGDTYTVTATAPGDLFGTGFIRFDSSAASVGAVSVDLVAPPSSGSMALAAQGGAIASMSEVETGVGANPVYGPSFSQALLTLPQGTETVHLTANVGSGGFTEEWWLYYYDHPGHPCQVSAGVPYWFADTQYSYAVLLAGRIVGSGSGSLCSTPMNGVDTATRLDLTLDVSAVTAEHDVDVRLVATTDNVAAGVYGWVNVSATTAHDLTLLSVEDVNGTGHVPRLSEVMPRKKGQMVKLMGVPHWAKDTVNQWGMRIRFRPTDAEIQEIKVYAENLGGPLEELTFFQKTPQEPGVIELANVGFEPAVSGSRPMWDAKRPDAFVVTRITAKLADGTIVTKTAPLGLDVAKQRAGQVLAPLYDAGDISGAIRFGSEREALWGYDGWGTDDSFNFLQSHPALSFNDLSLEHGGPFPPHNSHQRGTSIDLRYLGPNGPEDPLNGSNVTTRMNTWAAARQGGVANQAALRTMITWIQMNRSGMDALFDAGGIRVIYIDPILWHYNPIVNGTFGNGTQIIDPDTHVWIGAWSPHGKVQGIAPHLDHFHVERFVRTWGNPVP